MLGLVAAIGGAGTMIVELAAVRLLSPWFGSSHVVWTNVIAVVLLALSLGYLLGGWLSARGRPLIALGAALCGAGLWTAWLPALSAPVARAFLPAEVALQEAAELVLWGSLATSLLLFLPAALALGTVAPLAVEAFGELRHTRAGRAGGAVLFASTLGSLAGVFATSLLLLPSFGLARTFWIAAILLAGAGAGALGLARSLRSSRALLGLLALGVAGSGFARAVPPRLPEGVRELARAESRYQSVRVVEDTRGPERLRYLQVNEGFDSFQSVWQEDPGLLPDGFYYNEFALPAHWSRRHEARADGDWKVLALGLGGGTVLRVLEGALPDGLELVSTSVELDPVVVKLATEHLDLPGESERLRLFADADARVAARHVEGRFDQVVLDCYANQVEIPPHLATREFFAELRERLTDGGWLAVNLGGFGFDDPVVASVGATCARAFEAPVLLLRVSHARNFVLFARNSAPLPVEADGSELAREGLRLWSLPPELRGPRLLPGSFRVLEPEAEPDSAVTILTDDHAPMEALQARSIAQGRARLRAER